MPQCAELCLNRATACRGFDFDAERNTCRHVVRPRSPGRGRRFTCPGGVLDNFADPLANKKGSYPQLLKVVTTESDAACGQLCVDMECESFTRSGKTGKCRLSAGGPSDPLSDTRASVLQMHYILRPECRYANEEDEVSRGTTDDGDASTGTVCACPAIPV